jgi:predicted RNA-binding Zn-ribbon protein involved in translation (DUF1610 family)
MIEQHTKETCPGCFGAKVQVNNAGVRVLCPACGGKGFIWKSNFDDLPPGVYCKSENKYTSGEDIPLNETVIGDDIEQRR